jgi:glycosyltransferase involved in cell wall biosynthesis
MSKMMHIYGWRVLEYSNEGSISEAEHVPILSHAERNLLCRRKNFTDFFDEDVHNQELTTAFHDKVMQKLRELTKPYDIVCHVFGPIPCLVSAASDCFHTESGIGYSNTDGAMPYRIFESHIWAHFHYGKTNQIMGKSVWWSIPNYYDLDDWPVVEEPDRENPYILFFGRIKQDKGLLEFCEIAKRMPNHRFILCGQGDPSPWMQSPNIEYHSPLHGRERAKMLGNATVMLALSTYAEPFCGSSVEAQLCGTPVISYDFGAFVETVEHGRTGFRTHFLADMILAVERAPTLDRRYTAQRARSLYSLETVGKLYDSAFKQIYDMRDKGWYSEKSHMPLDVRSGQ